MTSKSKKNIKKLADKILIVLSVVWLIAAMIELSVNKIENTGIQLMVLGVGSLALSWGIYSHLATGILKYVAVVVFAAILTLLSFMLFAFVWFNVTQPSIGF